MVYTLINTAMLEALASCTHVAFGKQDTWNSQWLKQGAQAMICRIDDEA